MQNEGQRKENFKDNIATSSHLLQFSFSGVIASWWPGSNYTKQEVQEDLKCSTGMHTYDL